MPSGACPSTTESSMQPIQRTTHTQFPKSAAEAEELQNLLHLLHTENLELIQSMTLLPRLIRMLPQEQCPIEAGFLLKYLRENPPNKELSTFCTQALADNTPLFEMINQQLQSEGEPIQTLLSKALKSALDLSSPKLVDHILAHPQLTVDENIIEAICLSGTEEQFSSLVQRFQLKENPLPILRFFNNRSGHSEKIRTMLRSQDFDLPALIKKHEYLDQLTPPSDLLFLDQILNRFSVEKKKAWLTKQGSTMLFQALSQQNPLEALSKTFEYLIKEELPIQEFLLKRNRDNRTLLDESCRRHKKGCPELIIKHLDDASLKTILSYKPHPLICSTYEHCQYYGYMYNEELVTHHEQLIHSHEVRLGLI